MRIDGPTSWALLIAFGVVVLTTLGNTILEWLKLHWANKRGAETLRRALLEELKQARDTGVVNLERTANPEPGGSFLIPVTEAHRIYDANISNLGLLRPAEVSAVVRAYGLLQAQVETYAAIGTFHRREGPVLHAVVDSKWAEVLEANGRSLVAAIDKAVRALSGKER